MCWLYSTSIMCKCFPTAGMKKAGSLGKTLNTGHRQYNREMQGLWNQKLDHRLSAASALLLSSIICGVSERMYVEIGAKIQDPHSDFPLAPVCSAQPSIWSSTLHAGTSSGTNSWDSWVWTLSVLYCWTTTVDICLIYCWMNWWIDDIVIYCCKYVQLHII